MAIMTHRTLSNYCTFKLLQGTPGKGSSLYWTMAESGQLRMRGNVHGPPYFWEGVKWGHIQGGLDNLGAISVVRKDVSKNFQ